MIASANVCNVVLMRYSELTEGISVHDDQGTVVGTSQVAARHVSSHQCTQARYSNTHIYTVFCILYTFILYIYILYTWLLFPLFDCFLLCTSLWIKVSANCNVMECIWRHSSRARFCSMARVGCAFFTTALKLRTSESVHAYCEMRTCGEINTVMRGTAYSVCV